MSSATPGIEAKPSEQEQLTTWEQRLVTLLSVITGMVDLIGFFTLGNIFTAHITGNVVLVSAVFLRDVNPAQAFAIAVFFIAVAATWFLAKASRMHGENLVRLLLGVQFLLLTCVLAASVLSKASEDQQSLVAGSLAMVAVAAMACQHAMLRLAIPKAPSPAVMTGNVTNAVLALLEARSQGKRLTEAAADRRLARSLIVLFGFIGGCLSPALAVHFFQDWAWALPVSLTAAAVMLR